jgi:tRNA (guanine-N7-)-methyltransferase
MGKLGFMTNKTGGDDRFKWTFKDAFFGDDETGLLQVITADDGFQQKFYVRVIPRENSVLIKLDDASTVYRTPAVKESFKALAEEIGKL